MLTHGDLFFGLILFVPILACDSGDMPAPNDQVAMTDIDSTDSVGSNESSLDLTLTNRYGIAMYQYAQVDKNGNYFRRMFMDTSSFFVTANTGEIPDQAIIAMETWFGDNQSTVFYRTKNKGAWLSGSFGSSSPDFSNPRSINSCNNCHRIAESTDFSFTRPLISRAFQENEIQFIECDMGPTGPCDLETYLGGL